MSGLDFFVVIEPVVWMLCRRISISHLLRCQRLLLRVQHIHEEGELDEDSTCRKFRQVRTEGNRQVELFRGTF